MYLLPVVSVLLLTYACCPCLLCCVCCCVHPRSRFQPVTVPEPSIDETYEILQGLRERYETHHKLRYTGACVCFVVAAASLAATVSMIARGCCAPLYVGLCRAVSPVLRWLARHPTSCTVTIIAGPYIYTCE